MDLDFVIFEARVMTMGQTCQEKTTEIKHYLREKCPKFG
jgi:hypothetical protein